MILRSNLPKLREHALKAERVLDVGGWFLPFNLATHVIDLGSYETRHSADALDPEDAERFTAETWTVHDVCNTPWPFPDKYFDFVFCSHLLEDVRDPIAVCRELCRVGKSGYVETPSRLREIFSKHRLFHLKRAFGRIPEVGFHHHRWFVELEDNCLTFSPKTTALLQDPDYYLTRADVGRKLTEEESGLGFFWTDSFSFRENHQEIRESYLAFRKKAVASLRR